MKITKHLKEIIKSVAEEPFAADRIIGINRLLRTAYNEGYIVAKQEEIGVHKEVSDIKDKIIVSLILHDPNNPFKNLAKKKRDERRK